MKGIILIAPPAAGKGTQSKLISEKYHIPHISTGDLLRQEVEKQTDLGKQLHEIMQSGGLVQDDVILELLKKRLEASDCASGYVLDGFPRNVDQAIAYHAILESLQKTLGPVILLELSKEEAQKRILGRLSCHDCGSVYNHMDLKQKPQQEGICDKCSGALIKRSDDTVETFEHRYSTYLERTKPLIQYYEEIGAITRVDASHEKEYTFAQIEQVILNDFD